MNNHYLDEQCNEIQSNLKQNSDKTPVKLSHFLIKKSLEQIKGLKIIEHFNLHSSLIDSFKFNCINKKFLRDFNLIREQIMIKVQSK